ncbi:MAG TPA: phytoene/squalene synthase family protein [Pirellulales bacterium]|jgi:phytoene synthase|nr:phytoene/squalene synthase family protein [Pirellulales bacterium]
MKDEDRRQSVSVESSYSHCRQLTRRTASNFYYSFLVLPRPKRRAMCALYAFARLTDDLGDNVLPAAERRQALVRWRQSLDKALDGEFDAPIFPALWDTVHRYCLPPQHLHAVIDGVEMDLEHEGFETFDQLCDYCGKVASAVGLCCIHIWGFTGPEALEPARKCGIAFQLTNILRDLKEDAAAGRIYLPREDLRRFGYSVDDLRRGQSDERFKQLMRFQIDRAERLYQETAQLERWLEPDGQAIYGAMCATYRGLLDEIKRLDGDVFSHRVRLSAWRKLRIAGRSLLGRPPEFAESRAGAQSP